MNIYPNPCDVCDKADSCNLGYGCEDWRIRYLYRQKQINAHAKAQAVRIPTGQKTFVYEHPDLIWRYIVDGPCKGCKAELVCDMPCPAYLNWWDARMEIARKKVVLS